ncbi:MAG TPA: glycosyltransferase family 4 protein [Tepidisphaeraceae bacterium]|nr:glycosyltransferase family 4 protein [Tepidisphaeraceae bacterium]
MRILYVSGLTGFGVGGARTEEIRLVRGMAGRGLQVAMANDVLPPDLRGIEHLHIDYPPRDRATEQIAQAVEGFKPDLVHAMGGGVRFFSACTQALRDSRWILTTHNMPPSERIFTRLHGFDRLHFLARDLVALPSVRASAQFLRRANFAQVICHSKTVAKRLQALGCPEEKISEIPFGSEISQVAESSTTVSLFPSDAWPKIMTVAGLAHHKGQRDGIRMIHRLSPDFPRIAYRIVGTCRDTRFRAQLHHEIEKLGLTGRIQVLEDVKDPEKFAAMREADLYLQPSREEGFCIAFMEAAMFCPRLLGSDTGAIAAVAGDDPAACVVRPGDINALTDAARGLLKIDRAPQILERRRQELPRRYSWESYLNQHEAVYSRVLERRAHRE